MKKCLVGCTSLLVLVTAQAMAADMPLKAPSLPFPPVYAWTGLYLGGHAGALFGTTTFSDPYGLSVFGDKVRTPEVLVGAQLGYNWLLAPRWLLGLEAEANFLDSHDGNYTCLQASGTLIGSNCQVVPRALATFTGRVGFLADPQGHTLVYGKAGAAWGRNNILLEPNNSFSSKQFPQALFPGAPTSESPSLWGWTAGAGIEQALTPAWSLSLEYGYYRFLTHVPTPMTINVTQLGGFAQVPSNSSGVTQELHVVKLGLNYHWGQDSAAAWNSSPGYNLAAMPVKARPLPALTGWELDAGVRYWYSSGRSKNTTGSGSITSQLTYDNMRGNSGEVFARLDTPLQVFVKGFGGRGIISSGKMTDEDWGLAPPATNFPVSFEVTESNVSRSSLQYAAADIGFNAMRDRNYKLGPFIGYSYFKQTMNAFGCVQLVVPGSVCDPPFPANVHNITQEDRWESLRLGISAEAEVGDRFRISGDVAYLPFARYKGLDVHRLRQPVTLFPEEGTGRGVQADVILSYRATEQLTLGVGGRYWSMWSRDASQTCIGACFTVGSNRPLHRCPLIPSQPAPNGTVCLLSWSIVSFRCANEDWGQSR